MPACRWHATVMNPFSAVLCVSLVLLASTAIPSSSGELKVSREALWRTLKEQLFSGANGRYYLKGSPRTPCSIYAEDPQLIFVPDRIRVGVKTHARVGTSVHGACIGVSLAPNSEVSVAPDGEGETLGFRDARVERISSAN